MKGKIIQFGKDFILMAIVLSIVVFIFYKLNIVKEFNVFYIIGYMTGWSIWQIIKILIDNKKQG